MIRIHLKFSKNSHTKLILFHKNLEHILVSIILANTYLELFSKEFTRKALTLSKLIELDN